MAHLNLCWMQHTLKTQMHAESLMRKLFLYAFSVFRPHMQRRIVVLSNIQTSQSIVDAPWAEMMCKIAFLEACKLGEEASWNRHITSHTGRSFKWKVSIYSAQESSTLNPTLPGFLFWLLSWHGTHTHTHACCCPNANTQAHEPKAESWFGLK